MVTPKASLIGTILHTDELAISSTIRVWESTLIPIVNNIRQEYDNLHIGEFSDSTFRDTLENGVLNICAQCLEKEKKTLGDSPTLIRFLEESIKNTTLKPLSNLVTLLKTESEKIMSSIVSKVIIDWNDLRIEKKGVSLDKDAIRKKFEVEIKTEEQAELFEKISVLKDAWNQARDFAIEKGCNYPFFGYDGFVNTDERETLEINPHSITYI